jgi:polyhydroxyalkanoate synthesis repressor PhaR
MLGGRTQRRTAGAVARRLPQSRYMSPFAATRARAKARVPGMSRQPGSQGFRRLSQRPTGLRCNATNLFSKRAKQLILPCGDGGAGTGFRDRGAGKAMHMATERSPVTIKKYANRRLYHTGTSTYVTLEDLATMVKKGDDFLVFDAKTGEDITRSVLTQIIFEQEGKEGQNLLPIAFLRQLIRFYGDSLQALVPSYLELSIGRLTNEQQKFRDLMTRTFTGPALSGQPSLEEITRRNIAMFSQALAMLNPFAVGINGQNSGAPTPPVVPPKENGADLDDLKKQVSDMQQRLEKLASKG